MGASEVVARVTRQVQMNTRMDESLKEAGDAVLRQLGYTPSTAVRGAACGALLWSTRTTRPLSARC